MWITSSFISNAHEECESVEDMVLLSLASTFRARGRMECGAWFASTSTFFMHSFKHAVYAHPYDSTNEPYPLEPVVLFSRIHMKHPPKAMSTRIFELQTPLSARDVFDPDQSRSWITTIEYDEQKKPVGVRTNAMSMSSLAQLRPAKDVQSYDNNWSCVDLPKFGEEANVNVCWDDSDSHVVLYNSDNKKNIAMPIIEHKMINRPVDIYAEPTRPIVLRPFDPPPKSLVECVYACASDDACYEVYATHVVQPDGSKTNFECSMQLANANARGLSLRVETKSETEHQGERTGLPPVYGFGPDMHKGVWVHQDKQSLSVNTKGETEHQGEQHPLINIA